MTTFASSKEPFSDDGRHRAMAGKVRSRSSRRMVEGAIQSGLLFCAAFSIATTVAIIAVLSMETVRFFQLPDVTVTDFFFSMSWNPLLGDERHFGIWALISGTVLITGIAMMLAIPCGLIAAIFLSEYAPKRLRMLLKPVIEILAGIPTVVYGFFALFVITPVLQDIHGGFGVYNVLSAGMAVGIMCLPIVCSLSEDALQAVPRSLREGAYALGATRFDVSTKVVTPGAISGIVAASLLAIARAVGETMIVTLAAGNLARNLSFDGRSVGEWLVATFDVTEQSQTMTGFMVQVFLGDVSNFGSEYYAAYAVASSLFVLTFLITVAGHRIRVRFREAYA